jgi:predicted AAA+ superfamily ATPase
MFIQRELKKKLSLLKTQFPVIALLGPRQSGKTTLSREAFPTYEYVNLEELDIRQFANEDPKGFLENYAERSGKDGVIFDEIQNAPDLFSYLQVRVDKEKREGFYILTGSQNILLNQHISQTLAGRIAIQTLLPLSIEELTLAHRLPSDLFTVLYQGFYPSIYAKKIDPQDCYKGYIQTYVERDARQVRNISDLSLFQKFIKLCAGRIGQILNLTSLSSDCGISVNTARAWISILEASYVVFLLYPHHKNFSKRLVKSPKLYFYDPGLASHLLGIKSAETLVQHYLRGGLFESMILVNLMKQRFNAGKNSNLYFWRDKTGLEIDCLLEKGGHLIPIEIKSGETIHSDFFDAILRFCDLANIPPSTGYVVYGGAEDQKRQTSHMISWKSLSKIEN